MGLDRLLFASTHGCIDPSSGAALATRDLLELLAARGVDCRALGTGVLDFDRQTPLDDARLAAEYEAFFLRVAAGGIAP